jgi:hypothetical protein
VKWEEKRIIWVKKHKQLLYAHLFLFSRALVSDNRGLSGEGDSKTDYSSFQSLRNL